MLLAKARELQAGRDRWSREVAPTLSALRAAGCSIREVAAETGIPRGTVARLWLTSGRP